MTGDLIFLLSPIEHAYEDAIDKTQQVALSQHLGYTKSQLKQFRDGSNKQERVYQDKMTQDAKNIHQSAVELTSTSSENIEVGHQNAKRGVLLHGLREEE